MRRKVRETPESILREIYKENMMAFDRHTKPKPLDTVVMRKERDALLSKYYTLGDLRDLEKLMLVQTLL